MSTVSEDSWFETSLNSHGGWEGKRTREKVLQWGRALQESAGLTTAGQVIGFLRSQFSGGGNSSLSSFIMTWPLSPWNRVGPSLI